LSKGRDDGDDDAGPLLGETTCDCGEAEMLDDMVTGLLRDGGCTLQGLENTPLPHEHAIFNPCSLH
jgi:hypothetical protein